MLTVRIFNPWLLRWRGACRRFSMLDAMVRTIIATLIVVALVLAGLFYLPHFTNPPISTSASAPLNLPTRKQLVRMLKAGQFEELDAILSHLQTRYESGRIREDHLATAFAAFERADPDMAAPLEEWRETHPDSFVPHLAFGLYNFWLAWTTRGAERTAFTNKKQLDVMDQFLKIAKLALSRSVAITPRQPKAWAALIGVAMTSSDRKSLVDTYQKALVHQPNSSMVHRRYHDALSASWGGSFSKQFWFRKGLQLRFARDPQFHWVHYYWENRVIDGSLYNNSRGLIPIVLRWIGGDGAMELWSKIFPEPTREERARKALHFIREIVPSGDAHSVFIRRGDAFWMLQRLDDAFVEYARAFAIAPERQEVWQKMKTINRAQHRYVDAHSFWRKILWSDPYDPALLIRYSGFLTGIGEKANAARMLKRALVYGEHNDDVRREIARLYWILGMFDHVLSELKQAIELAPQQPKNWFRYARAYEHVRDCKAAGAYKTYLNLCFKWGTCSVADESDARNSIKNIEAGCD